MATATITSGFTVLADCNSTTPVWSGTNTLDTEFKKEGTGSISSINRTVGVTAKYITIAATNLQNTHLRMWFSYAAPGFIAPLINGGIRFYVFDGTNTGYWYISGSDVYDGGWLLMTVSTARPFDSGTCNLAAVTRVGFALNLTGAARNATNTWVDYLVYGNGYSVTGGTSVDPIKLLDIYNADSLGGFGLIRRINSVYFLNSKLTIGSNTTTNTYFEDDGQVLVFEDQPVSSTLYNLEVIGSTTNTVSFKIRDTILKSASTTTRFNLTLNNAYLDTLEFSGNVIINANQTLFKTGQTITSSTWRSSNRVIPNAAIMTGCAFISSPDTLGALEINTTSHNVTASTFELNSKAVYMPTAGTYTFNNLKFISNTTDINNTSGSGIVVNAINGSNPSIYTGIVTINNAVSLTLTGLKPDTEVRIYRVSDDVLLAGVESSGTSFQYSYNATGDVPVYIRIHHLNYLPVSLEVTLGATQTIPVQQIVDRQYYNMN